MSSAVTDSCGSTTDRPAKCRPPGRVHIYTGALGCGAANEITVYVLGSDGNLYLEEAPFGSRFGGRQSGGQPRDRRSAERSRRCRGRRLARGRARGGLDHGRCSS